MKFSIIVLLALTAIAAGNFGAFYTSGFFYIWLRFATIISVLFAAITAIYGRPTFRPFVVGWLIGCGGMVGLKIFGTNLIGVYLSTYLANPALSGLIHIDLALLSGYFGGYYANVLQCRNTEPIAGDG